MSASDDDLSEAYRAMRDDSKLRRQANLSRAIALLDAFGIKYRTKNNGVHLMIDTQKGVIDYWPSTGLWHFGKTWGRGLRRLVTVAEKAGIDQ